MTNIGNAILRRMLPTIYGLTKPRESTKSEKIEPCPGAEKVLGGLGGKALGSASQGDGSGPGFEPGSDPIDKRCVANPPDVFPDPITNLPEHTALDHAWEK